MRAAIFESFGEPLTIQNVSDPRPGADAVVVQVQANGICRSDWHGWMGHDPDVTLEESLKELETMDAFSNVGVSVITEF